MMMTETSQCSNKPMNGALRGLLLAQRREKGSIPSRPISCTTGKGISDPLKKLKDGGETYTDPGRK